MNTTTLNVTLTTDLEADAGYIATGLGRTGRQVARTVPIRSDDGQVHGAIDLDADGVLIGIEILALGRRLPGLTTFPT